MMLADPEKMAEAKAKAGRQIRFFLRWLLVACLPLAYYVGTVSGQLQAVNQACAAWVKAGRR